MCLCFFFCCFYFFFNDTAPTEIYTLSLHDALPIYLERTVEAVMSIAPDDPEAAVARALLDRQAGIGEILHVDGPSLVVGAACTADGRGFIALCNGIVSNDPVKRLATLVVGDASPSASPRVLRLDIRQALGVSFSPDRRSVFVGAIDGMFQFDVQTGRRLGRWETGWVDEIGREQV